MKQTERGGSGEGEEERNRKTAKSQVFRGEMEREGWQRKRDLKKRKKE